MIIYVHVKNQTNIHPRSPEEVFILKPLLWGICRSCELRQLRQLQRGHDGVCSRGSVARSLGCLGLGAPTVLQVAAEWVPFFCGWNMGKICAKHGKSVINSPSGPLKIPWKIHDLWAESPIFVGWCRLDIPRIVGQCLCFLWRIAVWFKLDIRVQEEIGICKTRAGCWCSILEYFFSSYLSHSSWNTLW